MKQSEILVIEDNPAISKLVRVNLTARGYDVTEVSSAEDGLKTLEEWTPRVIVLDLLLPGMSGLGFLEEIRESDEWGAIPVIIISAVANAPLHRVDGHTNVVATFLKPLNISDLIKTIQSTIHNA